MRFDPSETYVHLLPDGAAQRVPGGERFWSLPPSEAARFDQGWMVTEFKCASDWPNWEMHPEADEFVYLLSGAAVMVLESPSGTQEVPLSPRGAVVVPRGVWHTAKVRAPSRMLFVTSGRGTQHRAA